jgi:hypothetical protein
MIAIMLSGLLMTFVVGRIMGCRVSETAAIVLPLLLFVAVAVVLYLVLAA